MNGHVYAPEVEPDSTDIDAIHNACLDYIESWYDADPNRMRGCLHPDLDKRGMVRRIIDTRADEFATQPMTASWLLRLTELGLGTSDPDDRPIEITILDSIHHLASVKVIGNGFVDLLHLMKFPDGWKITQSSWSLTGGIVANMTTDA